MAYTYTYLKNDASPAPKNPTSFLIHKTDDPDADYIHKIYLDFPKDTYMTASNTTTQLTVNFPKGTQMHLEVFDAKTGAAVEKYFDYHYMAFLLVRFTIKKDDGSTKTETVGVTSRTIRDKYTHYEADYIIMERDGAYSGNNANIAAGTNNWAFHNESEKSFTIAIPSNAIKYSLVIRGESNLTPLDGGELETGNFALTPCPCDEVITAAHPSADLFGEIDAGSIDTISILENGKIRVTGTEAEEGTNNKVKSCVLTVTCKGIDADKKPFETSTDIKLISSAEAGGDSFTKDDVSLLDGTTMVSATLSSQGVLGMERSDFGDQITVTIDKPNPPTSIAYSTAKMNRPRLKDNLTWSWSGASRGTKSSATSYNATIDGYRVMIYKNNKNGGATGSIQLKDISGWTPSHTNPDDGSTPIPYVEKSSTALSGSLTFNPIENVNTQNTADPDNPIAWNTFVANDRCYCRVYSYAKWGPNNVYSSKSLLGIVDSSGTNTKINYVVVDPANNPSNKQTKCVLHNAAVVRVRAPKSTTDSTLVWREGTVYVYNGSTWQEAEAVYVCTDVDKDTGKATWQEST